MITSAHEMGGDWRVIEQRIAADVHYRQAFKDAYPDAVTKDNILSALADYQRTLLTPGARFDRYLQGDTEALTLEEKKYGYQRFKDYGCIACHQGVNIGATCSRNLACSATTSRTAATPPRRIRAAST